jgi:hypothetical protein
MAQADALAVYRYIEEFWGESLTADLAFRISAAPRDHLTAFKEQWPGLGGLANGASLDPLMPGQLRPILSTQHDVFRSGATLEMLLYVPQVVESWWRLNPMENWDVDEFNELDEFADVVYRVEIEGNFGWLAALKPLVLDGSLLFTGKRRSYRYHRDRFDYADPKELLPYFDEQIEIPRTAAWLSGAMDIAERNLATIVPTTYWERRALAEIFGRQVSDGRVAQIGLLGSLSIPGLRGNAAAIVRLRSASDAFAQFRGSLQRALSLVAELPDTAAGMVEASAIVADELRTEYVSVQQEADRSSLANLRTRGRALLLGGLGAGIPAALSENPWLTGGLAGGGAVAGAMIDSYIEARKNRRAARAVWDVVLAFESDRS